MSTKFIVRYDLKRPRKTISYKVYLGAKKNTTENATLSLCRFLTKMQPVALMASVTVLQMK